VSASHHGAAKRVLQGSAPRHGLSIALSFRHDRVHADAKLVRPLEGVDSTETSPADRLSVKDLTRVRIYHG
jgi:hypothetical protein